MDHVATKPQELLQNMDLDQNGRVELHEYIEFMHKLVRNELQQGMIYDMI